MRAYPAYTIRANIEGCCIITEYGLIAKDQVYILSWEYYLSTPPDYDHFAQIADAMVYSFESITPSNTLTRSDILTSPYNNQTLENTTFTKGTIGTNVTASGAIFLGESYQNGDKYINLDNPSTTCIDNNSNRVCDATEPNPPLSCRYDRACSNIPRQTVTQGSTNGSSNAVVQQYNNSNLYPPTLSQQNRINWGEICMSPLVDYVITEPCTTLTSPDGYTLTAEGERVLRCLAGGALVGLLAPELLTQIRQLGPAVNCGG